jgi:hypothetical protein
MRELPLKKTTERNRRPAPSTARTDRDVRMIVLGVALILLFLLGGYLSIDRAEPNPISKPRGPVKDPGASSLNDGSFLQNENPLRRAYRLVSMPFPDGVFEQG